MVSNTCFTIVVLFMKKCRPVSAGTEEVSFVGSPCYLGERRLPPPLLRLLPELPEERDGEDGRALGVDLGALLEGLVDGLRLGVLGLVDGLRLGVLGLADGELRFGLDGDVLG